MDKILLESRLKEKISSVMEMPVEQIGVEDSFKDDLNMDSLELIEMVMELEDELDTTIGEEDLAKFSCIKDIMIYVEKNC